MPDTLKPGDPDRNLNNKNSSGYTIEDIQFRKLIEKSHDGISMLDEELNVVYSNSSAQAIVGWKIKDRIKGGLAKFFHPDDQQRIRSDLDDMLHKPGQTITSIYRTKHPVGNFKWIEWAFTNMLNEPGINAIVCNFHDITEKKQTDDLLKQRAEHVEKLLKKANALAKIGGWEVNLVNRTIYWSDITREIHEAEPGFFPDIETVVNFYKEGESRETIIKVMEEAIKNCTSDDREIQIVTAKGNIKWVRVIVEAEFIDGKCNRVYGSFQDIDARKNAEIAETQALEERNTILESIDDAFFAVDKNWIVTYWNHMAEKVLGRPKNEILNHNIWDVYSDSIKSESYRKYHEAIETNQVVRFEDYYAPLDKWYEISAFPSTNGLSVYFKDITERLNYIKAIEQQNENLREISWIQSHLVRAPLARIMGLIGIIGDPGYDAGEKKKALEYLLASSNELDDIIRNITNKTNMPGKLPTEKS